MRTLEKQSKIFWVMCCSVAELRTRKQQKSCLLGTTVPEDAQLGRNFEKWLHWPKSQTVNKEYHACFVNLGIL